MGASTKRKHSSYPGGSFFFSRFVIKSLQCELKVHRFMMLKSWDVGFRLVTVAALFLQD